MRQNLSIYLHLLRFVAAVGVLLFHAKGFVAPHLPAIIADHGEECVAIFFVLSGFVIRHANLTSELTWRQYLSARLARLYPVVILALLVTFAADAFGRFHNSTAYEGASWFNSATSWTDVAKYLTFTNEIWGQHAIVGSDEPFWSLGFEALYYVLFGLITFTSSSRRFVLIIAWIVFVGPKIALYLPLWLLGVGAYEYLRRIETDKPRSFYTNLALFIGSLALLIEAHFRLRPPITTPIYEIAPVSVMLHTAGYYLMIGIITSINIIAFDRITSSREIWAGWLARLIRTLAAGTFTLYLCHEPILAAVAAVFPNIRTNLPGGYLAIVGIGCVIAILAWAVEGHKRTFRAWANAIVSMKHLRLSQG